MPQPHNVSLQENAWGANDFAERLRGFGPLGILSILAIVLTGNVFVAPMVPIPVGAILVLAWARLSRTPWTEIGYVRPRPWAGTLAVAIVCGCVFKLVMKALVMPLLGADAINQAYHFLAGNTALLPAATWAMLNAGFSEETVFRGYLFERLGKLLGPSAAARTFIVFLTSALFALAHYSGQGVPGVEQAAITGLVFGTIFALTRRVFPLMVAHAAFDLTALALIYWNLETTVGHLILK